MKNFSFFYYMLLVWVLIVLGIWFYFRRKFPELIGLGRDLNKQKIDKVKLKRCPKCGGGELEPIFPWWRYLFGILIPPGVLYIVGKPGYYLCSNCKAKHGLWGDERFLTRISLTYRIRKPFMITFLCYCFLVVFLLYIYG